MAEKRKIHPALRKILDFDVYITQKFVLWANHFLPFRSLRIHYKMLEYSCHGIPWLAGWLAFSWLFSSASLIQMQVNMFFGLVLDIIFIAVIKAAIRRRRPVANNDDMLSIGPDKYSFPSGHASRAVFVAYFFINLFPLHFIFIIPFLSWATAVCLSRILLNRHNILDVLGGVLLGLMEGVLLGWVWFGQGTCEFLYSWITDEKLDGGEYHV